MSLCFLEAYKQTRPDSKGETGISQEQYFDHILAHLRGVRHEGDQYISTSGMLGSLDPWVGAFRDLALKPGYEPLQDTEVEKWKGLLKSCRDGNHESFEIILQSMGPSPHPSPIQVAACAAAQNGHFDLMRYCLEKGAHFSEYLDQAAQKGVRTVEELEYLYEQDWSRVRTSPKAAMSRIRAFGKGSFQAEWLIRHALPPGYKEVDKKSLRRPGFREKDEYGRWSSEQLEEWFGDLPW